MSRAILFLLPFLLFFNCARQTAPTGGPQDTIPPLLIQSRTIPKNEQINFKEQKLTLTFNETVILNNPKEQIIIIPDIEKKYEIKARKNTVVFSFDNPLQDSTTYSINFRDAIQDITEKNPPPNLKLAFSTGSYIDSLSIEGHARNLLKNQDLKDITIALYQSDTFNIFKHKPIFLTKSDKKGIFSIENLKPGKYFIYGFDDRNRNLIVDSKTEEYGFITTSITLKKDTSNLNLPTVKQDIRPLILSNARPYNTYYNIKLNKNIIDYRLKNKNQTDPVYATFGEDQSSLKVYNTFKTTDSTSVQLFAKDSANNFIDTLLYVKFSTREVKKEPFKVTPLGTKVIQEKGLLKSSIQFSKPLHQISFDSMYYALDSIRSIPITITDVKYDSVFNILTIEKKFDKKLLRQLEPDTTTADQKTPTMIYTFVAAKKTFISIESDSAQALEEISKPLTPENTGIIIVETNYKGENYIIELRDKTFNLIDFRFNTSKVQFEDLVPGDYQVSLVIDTDKNGKWSAGNMLKKQEPEKIIYYKNEKGNQIISLKANWEYGPLLINP